MKIVLAGYGQYKFFAPAWVKALRSLGHQVVFFDFKEYLYKGLWGKIEYHLLYGPGLAKLNKSLIELSIRECPDIIAVHNGNPVYTSTIEELKRIAWTAGYQHDDPFGAFSNTSRFRNYRKTIPYYDSHHVIREINIDDYKTLGANNIALLRTYYVPWLHYPIDVIEKDIDVTFIGHCEKDDRLDYASYLINKGVSLRIFGYDGYWKRYLPRHIYNQLPPIELVNGENYVKTILRSKICLAFYSTANRDDYAYRVFEIPACRGFLLAKRTQMMQELYKENKEAVLFGSPSELYEKIRYYLTHDEQREKIARNGYFRALHSEYDVVSKMKQWLRETCRFMN